jgi:predicted metal-dependent enzyme (double-stranded beta helix superfamily)
MWAVIGIYMGCEQNFFYRRSGHSIARHGMRELNSRDTSALGAEAIHAVTNPLDRVTAAIHVYGGDFFGTPRSEWDPTTLVEQPYDTAATLRTTALHKGVLRDRAAACGSAAQRQTDSA